MRKSRCVGLRKKHPGVIIGHRLCMSDGALVPSNMGWLWNAQIVGLPSIRRGWRPGAVRKSVAKIMEVYLTPPAEPAPPVKQDDPPTLRVQKKKGEYTIVMNPLRDESKALENPSPIVFKVTKSDDVKQRSCARKILKSRGIEKKCNCATIDSCNCLTGCEKTQLKSEMEQVSKELCLKPELSVGDLRDSSESEVDVEFTPPSALKQKSLSKKCKPVKVSVAETQCDIPLSGARSIGGDGEENKTSSKKSIEVDGKK